MVFSSLTAPLARKGRYVRVQLAGSGVMQLAVVEVLGVPAATVAPDPAFLRNVALGRPATQSSVAGNAAAALAVDGNADGAPARRSVAQTSTEATPWWEVDLGASLALQSVQLWNRSDCCRAALSGFTVFVSAAPMTGRTLADLDADPAVWKRQVAGPVAAFTTVPLETKGRYLRVQLRAANAQLSLAEVAVLGVPR